MLCETSRSIKESLETLETVWLQLARLNFKSNVCDDEVAREIFRAKLTGRGPFYDGKPAGYFGRIYFVDLMHSLNGMKKELASILSDDRRVTLYSRGHLHPSCGGIGCLR